MTEEHQEPHEPQEQRVSTRVSSSSKQCASRESSEKTVAQIARDLGAPERVFYRWRHELRDQADHRERAFPGKGHQSALEEENRRRRRREQVLLKQVREIVKKRSVSSRAASHAVRLHRHPYDRVRGARDVPRTGRLGQRLVRLAPASAQCPSASRRGLERADPQGVCLRPRSLGQSAPVTPRCALPVSAVVASAWLASCTPRDSVPTEYERASRARQIASLRSPSRAPNLLARDCTASVPNRQ
jgi:hypothetical protein